MDTTNTAPKAAKTYNVECFDAQMDKDSDAEHAADLRALDEESASRAFDAEQAARK